MDINITRKDVVLIGCVSLFIACLMISSVTASKLWSIVLPFINYEVVIPVGTSLFALTFLCTDVIAEVWGRKYSMVLVWYGLLARILMVLFFVFAVKIEPVDFWHNQEAYQSILSGSTRIIVAGIIAYIISQTNDVFVFHYLKERDFGKNMLWKRNNLSTFSSQFLDSFLFIVIAFAGSATISQIVSMIAGQVVIKWVIALLDTPFVYILRNIALSKPLFYWKDI